MSGKEFPFLNGGKKKNKSLFFVAVGYPDGIFIIVVFSEDFGLDKEIEMPYSIHRTSMHIWSMQLFRRDDRYEYQKRTDKRQQCDAGALRA